MKKIKKIAAAAASLAVMAATTMSLSGSAVTTVRDPDGDGRILVSDGSFILQYLAGNFNPTSQRSLDFDGNGIISNKDATMLVKYWMQLIDGSNILDESKLPAPVGADAQAVATTREYVRHYYNNSASNQVYSLTVDPRDNTASTNNGISPYNIPNENDLVPHDETAIVRLNYGTGFIIDDHVIATAAHCVYDYTTGEFHGNDITLTDSEGNSRVVYAKYTDLYNEYYSYEYDKNDIESDGIYYDYALLYVEEDLSDYGFMKMGVVLDEYINNHGEIYASGFPSNYQGERYKAKGTIGALCDNDHILHYAYVDNGQSGGPVYVEEEFTTAKGEKYSYQTVIAINHGRHMYEAFYALRITPDLLKFYYDNSNIDY